MNENTLTILGFIFVVVGIVLILIGGFGCGDLSEDNEILIALLKADAKASEVSVDAQQAEMYYNLAGLAYENMNYKSVESNCLIAREYYFKESNGYKEIKSELKSLETDEKIIEIYIEMMDYLSEIADNMFEACEYFESAARYYDKYYNTNVPYDDMSYKMGNGELERMNEKIKVRDNAVGEYNNLRADYKFELNKRFIE